MSVIARDQLIRATERDWLKSALSALASVRLGRFGAMSDQHIGDDGDVAEILSIRERVEEAVNRGDAGGLAMLFSDEIAMLPDGSRVHGAREVEDFHRQLFDQIEVNEHFAVERIIVLGDLAVEFGTYSYEMSSKDDESVETGDGRYLYTYDRDESGHWKIHRMSWS